MNSLTPQAVDAYNRFMVNMFNEMDIIAVPTGFQSIFGRGGPSKTLFSPNANVVDIDILRGNEKTALLVLRGSNSTVVSGNDAMNLQKYTSFSRKYPLVEDSGHISASQLNERLAGEKPYAPMSKFQKMREYVQSYHFESLRRIIRLDERLSAQVMLTGVQDGILGTSNTALQYDFKRLASHTVTVSPLWDGVTPDIMGDVDNGFDLARQDGHIQPNIAILGGDAVAALINDATTRTTADIRRYELVSIGQAGGVPKTQQFMVDGGFEPIGRFRTERGRTLWLYTYNEVFTDASNNPVFYMPKHQVLMFSSEARFDRYYGPSEVLPARGARLDFMREVFGFDPSLGMAVPNVKNASHILQPGAFYFDAYESADGKTMTVRTQHAPIFAPVHTDSIVTLNVTTP